MGEFLIRSSIHAHINLAFHSFSCSSVCSFTLFSCSSICWSVDLFFTLVHSFDRLFRSFIHSLLGLFHYHLFILDYIAAFTFSFIHSFIQVGEHSVMCEIIAYLLAFHNFTHSLLHSFLPAVICSFCLLHNCSFIHSFPHFFMQFEPSQLINSCFVCYTIVN